VLAARLCARPAACSRGRRSSPVGAIAVLPAPLPVQRGVAASEISIVLTAQLTATADDVNLAAYRSIATTRIGRGENGGRALTVSHRARFPPHR
jgi:hypothetical protein